MRAPSRRDDVQVPYAPIPGLPPVDPALESVGAALNPILVPLGFAAGQAGASDTSGQVIFCRGFVSTEDDGCVDLVVDLEASPEWRITSVRYWGFPSERWQLTFDRDASLGTQLANLASTLPDQLAS